LAAEFTEIVSYTWSLFLAAGIRFGQNLYFDNENEELRSRDLIPLYLYEGKYFFAHGTAE